MSDRLHILSVSRNFPSPTDPSAGIFILNRVEAMARQADVHAIQPVPYFPGVTPLPDWARLPGRTQRDLRIEHAPMFYLPRLLKQLDARWLERAVFGRARRLHGHRQLHLIDAHFGYPEGAGCLRIGQRLGLPVFITLRGFENEYVHARDVGPPMIAAMRAATGCVAVSHSLRKLAIEHGVEPGQVTVVHNAVNSRLFHFEERLSARHRLGIDPTLPLVVSVGNLISRKRHHVLVEAFARLRARHPQARLVVIGAESFESDYPIQLRAQVRRLGLDEAVEFPGNLEPVLVADWLAAADAFALGTAREGCCNAVLEALAVGTPVVTTPVGDNAHFVKESVNGFLVPVDDSAALSHALELVLANPSAWRREANAVDLHRQVGDWEGVAARVLEFFEARLAAAGWNELESTA